MMVLSLCGVFAVMIALLWLKRPLWQALAGSVAAAALLYRIDPALYPGLFARVFTHWGNLSVLCSLYLITFLQRMLEARSQIRLASQDLDGIFHNRRVNAAVAPVFIGLLPSAAAMILCGDLVKDATEGYLEPCDQAVAASWFRHIPESTLPTYTAVILMMSLSGVPAAQFVPGMFLPVVFLFSIGYFFFLRRLPTETGTPASTNRLADLLHLVMHLWTLLLLLALMLLWKVPVVYAVLGVILLAVAVYRFSPSELAPFVVRAFEKKMIGNTFWVLVLKEFLSCSGALQALPPVLAQLPVPPYMVFALLFLLGGIVSGSTAIIAMGVPLAFAAIPEGGTPLIILLMGMVHTASMLSPTHVCLVVAADYFGVSLGAMIRRTLPFALLFGTLMILYYRVLVLFF